MRKITEEGVQFRSHIDGSPHFFTPENVVDIQRRIGSDNKKAYDESTPWPSTHEYAKASMEMTLRWLDRCLDQVGKTEPVYGYEQILAPIVQGSTYPDLRRISAELIASKNAQINAIGGLSVGEPADEMYAMTAEVCAILPKEKPRYLMGVGTPANLLESIALGVDLFDCVLPSRNARHGLLYTREGVINIKNEKWKQAHIPLDQQGCTWSKQYSRAYLRHLLMNNEILGSMIATAHNLSFYIALVREARARILEGTFRAWKDAALPLLEQRL
jgi:queuine tRNA-ribosyltransferase